MTAGRWSRLALAIALLALAGTPAARAFCAAACDSSVAHGSHARPVEETARAHEHAHHHAPTGEARLTPADAGPCDDLTVAAIAGTRATAAAAAPALVEPAYAIARPSAPRPRAVPRTPLRPPGGAAAPLPLRI